MSMYLLLWMLHLLFGIAEQTGLEAFENAFNTISMLYIYTVVTFKWNHKMLTTTLWNEN